MRASLLRLSAFLVASFMAGCRVSEPTGPVPVASVLISPTDPLVVLSESVRLTALAHDARGNAVAGREVEWSSSDDTKATVSSSGEVTPKALGSVEITATIEQKAATTTISVIPVPVAVHVSNFFTAFTWLGNIYSSPIPTQLYDVSQCPEVPNALCLDDNINQQRVQWNDVWDWQPVAAWAAKNPGHVYTIGDDLNAGSYAGIYVDNPKLYAVDYCTFVRNVQGVDPTAEFTPTMIHDTVEDWWLNDLANEDVGKGTAAARSAFSGVLEPLPTSRSST